MTKLKGIFVLDQAALELVYGPHERARIYEVVEMVAPPQTAASLRGNPSLLSDVEVLFSGWGGPLMDDRFCKEATSLQAVFYAAGSVSGIITPCVWEQGIRVTTASLANAIPVAEYTLAAILFSLKHAWSLARLTRQTRSFVPRNGAPGVYGSQVGLISMGLTARCLVKLLRSFQIDIAVYDPFLSDKEAVALGVRKMTLLELFSTSDVVSLHAPLLDETIGLVTGSHFNAMKHGATFINTSRGTVVRQDEMIAVAQLRSDLQFILDVADPEPPPPGSELYVLPNVLLTPHVAGSVGPECRRLGALMVEELDRYIAGESFAWEVTPELAMYSSHRPTGWKPHKSIPARTRPRVTIYPAAKSSGVAPALRH